MRVVQAVVGVQDVRFWELERRGDLRDARCGSAAHKGCVEVVANTQVELVHPASIPLQGDSMNLGFRTILLIAAVVLFVIAVFSDERWADLVALGLAAFAGAFLSDAMGWADRTVNSSRGNNRSDTT